MTFALAEEMALCWVIFVGKGIFVCHSLPQMEESPPGLFFSEKKKKFPITGLNASKYQLGAEF